MKINLKYILIYTGACVAVISVVYALAGIAYGRELDLYEYYHEIEEKNYFNPRWTYDVGFSSFIYFISPFLWSPEMLSTSVMLVIFIISANLFKGSGGILKASLFCLSYPVLLGSVNQLRATLFMVLFLFAVNSSGGFKFAKTLIAGSMHIYSFMLFGLIALRKFLGLWFIILLAGFLILIQQYDPVIYYLVDIWKSYNSLDINITAVGIKACIISMYLGYVRSRFDAAIVVISAISLYLTDMHAILDRFLTLCMMLVFFEFLMREIKNKIDTLKYILFMILNSIMLANSTLLWSH